MVWTGTDPLGQGLTVLWPVAVCPRKAVTQSCNILVFMLKSIKKLAPRFATFQQVSLFLC